MTETELQERRRHKWRLDGRPMRTLEEAREFIGSVGFCLMYPLKPPVLAPTFVGAYAGNDENLPTWQHVFADPRATESLDLMVRLLRERAAYETNLFGKTNFLVSAAVFPFFYALMGDRNPRRLVRENSVTGHGRLSALAKDVYRAIQLHGPITTKKFGGLVGGELSDAGLDRALNELWASLMITRVDYNAVDGASWDVLYRWSPEAVKEGAQLSVAEAVSALVSKYLDCVVAAEPQEVEDFFAPMVARSRVSEAIKALLTTRDFSFSHTGARSLVCMTPPASGPGKFPRMPRTTSSRHQKNGPAEVRNPDQQSAQPAPVTLESGNGVPDGLPAIQGQRSVPPQTERPRGPQENSIFKRRIPVAGIAGLPLRPPSAIGSRSSGPRNPGETKSRPQRSRPALAKPAAGSRPAYSRKPSASRDSSSRSPKPAFRKPALFSPAEKGVADESPAFAGSTGAGPDYAASAISPPVDAGSSLSQPAGSGYVKPAFAKTGFAKSRSGNPRPANKFGKPGFDKPGARRSSFGRPPSREGRFGDSRPAASRSGKPASGESGSGAPRFTGTRSSERGSGPSRFGKPRFSKPDSGRSGLEKSAFDNPRPGESRSSGSSIGPVFSRVKPGRAKPGGTGFGGSRFGKSRFGKSKFGKSKTSKDGNYLPRRGPRKTAGAERGGKIRDLKEKPGSEPKS